MKESFLEAELDALLSEDENAIRLRERSTFDQVAIPFGNTIVLFGAGNLGRRTLAGLRRHGIEPVAFADNNDKLWNTFVEGVEVLRPAEAAAQFGKKAVFVVTIWRAGGTHRQAQTRNLLTGLGCTRIVSVGQLYWKYPDSLLPHYAMDLAHKIPAQYARVRKALGLWADEASRREFLTQIRWRMWLDFDSLASPIAHEQYFPDDLFDLNDDEAFVDCGAYDGDSLKAFLKRRSGAFSSFTAIEPDPANVRQLKQYVATLDPEVQSKISVHQVAVGAEAGILRFEAEGKMSSAASTQGTSTVVCVALDDLLAAQHPTYIKMDIEGAETGALIGGHKVIDRDHPILAIGAYHQQDHLWNIPLYIRDLSTDYRLYLRPHNEEGWDLVCYAIPSKRLSI